MKSMNLKSAIWLTLAVSASVLAAGGPPPGKGGGGGGGGEETLSNNLSVPAVLVGGALSATVGCGADGGFAGLVAPSGTPLTSFPIDPSAHFYVQGVHKWQAECTTAASGLFVEGAWGDNLAGDAKLKAGSPIRVELLLLSNGVWGKGYEVVKLDPSALDRESSYGTLATVAEGGGYSATAVDLRPVVYDAGARFSVVDASGDVVVADQAIAPEINATGKVVYGYNLRVSAPGKYTIKFTMPNIIFTGCDVANTCVNSIAEMTITVGGGGGGGGGKGGGKPTSITLPGGIVLTGR
jgi:hypothetical protein